MKKTPSMAMIERKKRACGIGELSKAFVKWLRLAPMEIHCPKPRKQYSLERGASTYSY